MDETEPCPRENGTAQRLLRSTTTKIVPTLKRVLDLPAVHHDRRIPAPAPQAARRHPRVDHPRRDRRPHPPGRDEPHGRNQPAHYHHHPRSRPTRLPVRRSRHRNMLQEGLLRCAVTTATTSSPLPNAVAPTPSNVPAKPCRNSTKQASGAPSCRSPLTPASPAHGSTPRPNCVTNSAG